MKITWNTWGQYFRKCPVVTLDGAALKDCIEADDVEGYAIVYDDAPHDSNGDTVPTKRVTGKIGFIGDRYP